jgi:phytoene dehydrogenase-like protein
MRRACVIGSGPNGLAAAIVLAQAGLNVEVFEAQAQPGGAARTMPLTLPGFHHDFGSAVHPMAAGSPFFNTLPLDDHGLRWIHGDAPLAHPLDDGTAAILERNLSDASAALGEDGAAWRRLLQPAIENWQAFSEDSLGPLLRIPRHPLLMARFGLYAFQSAQSLAASHFRKPRTRALFAGLAAHSFLSLDQPLSSSIGLVLAAAAHAVGWPIPRGGAQSITDALVAELQENGGKIHTSHRISSLSEMDGALTMADLTPRQLIAVAGDKLRPTYRRTLSRYRYGPGSFKIDYALSSPVPWQAPECRRAITVHLGGTLEEIAHAEAAVARGEHPERPFVLLAQPTLFDSTRAPESRHIAWAYCHVPNGSTVDMTARIESQIERFAPGFADCILARHVSSPAILESMDENLVGGDINGGAFTLRQFLFRPSIHNYYTGTPGLYLCSASTPPGGGVHGMCGYHAAQLALRQMNHLKPVG